MIQWRTTRAAVLTAVLTLAACGGDDDAGLTTTDAPAATDAPAPTDAPAATDAPAPTDAAIRTDPPPATDAPATTGASETTGNAADYEQPAEAAGLQLVSTSPGDVLADADGWTVYLFTPDDQGESACYDACEANWPVVEEVAAVGDGLDPALLGTTTRTDGTVQATYNGWPLYTFAGDPGPGMTNGQGLNDVWWVIDADGNAVDA